MEVIGDKNKQMQLSLHDQELIRKLREATFGVLNENYVDLSLIERNREIMRTISNAVSILSKDPFYKKFKNLNFEHIDELKISQSLVIQKNQQFKKIIIFPKKFEKLKKKFKRFSTN